MELHQSATLDMPVGKVWALLNDPGVLKLCVPGCQEIKVVDESNYVAKAVIKVGFISSKFDSIRVRKTEAVENQKLAFEMAGEDSNKIGTVKQLLKIGMSPDSGDPSKTNIEIDATIDLTGKFATLGKRIVEWKAKGMTEEFVQNLRKTSQTQQAT